MIERMHYARRGSGKPLLLVHGLGGNRRSWDPILEPLAARRDVIAVDLPGHGDTPPLAMEPSPAALADALVAFLHEHDLTGTDAAGSSLGARLVLELARRGAVGNVVALAPGGFWIGFERSYFELTIAVSIRLVRALLPALPLLTGNAVSRSALLLQFSAHPWTLAPDVVLAELTAFAEAASFDPILRALARGPRQAGTAWTPGRVTIGWGRQDRVCLPHQAARALQRFPAATLHWFEACGHFPQWDSPEETASLILAATV